MRPTNYERKVVRTMMLIILLAAATHLCTAQLAKADERYLAPARGADVELRADATVVGNEARFRQLARWADADKATFDPIADLVVVRFAPGQAFRRVELREIKNLLTDAGVNVAPLNFVGSIACTLTRSDVTIPEGAAIDQFHAARTESGSGSRVPGLDQPPVVKLPPTPKDALSSRVDFAGNEIVSQSDQIQSTQTLRDALTQNLAEKLNLSQDTLQLVFRPQDEKILRLAAPQFGFAIEPQRTGNLGNVSWSVTITSDKGTTRVFLPADAKAWQHQLVIARPLSTKQVITEQDVVDRRTLVDRLDPDTLLARPQTVGQMAARELKPGTVVTAKLVDAVQLVLAGQYVTIESAAGNVSLKIVGKALDAGTLGQTVRVRNEATREVIQATVTGPQTASLG